MTKKVHGGVKKGTWFERDVSFVTLTFSADVTTSAFGIPGSCLDNAVAVLAQRKATVLGVRDLYSSGTKVDVILGHAQGWTSDNVGVIVSGVAVDGVAADLTTVVPANVTINFSKFQALPADTAPVAGVDGQFRPA